MGSAAPRGAVDVKSVAAPLTRECEARDGLAPLAAGARRKDERGEQAVAVNEQAHGQHESPPAFGPLFDGGIGTSARSRDRPFGLFVI
jgi:hypothetical protein